MGTKYWKRGDSFIEKIGVHIIFNIYSYSFRIFSSFAAGGSNQVEKDILNKIQKHYDQRVRPPATNISS